MYFTRAQQRAIWFVLILMAAALLFHYVRYRFSVESDYDFSAFEKRFVQKRDSLRHAQQQDTLLSPLRSRSTPLSSSPGTGRQNQGFPVNVNRAGAERLMELPRIGPRMAQRIIEYREKHGPFKSKEDIMKIKGIGPKTYEKLKDIISLD